MDKFLISAVFCISIATIQVISGQKLSSGIDRAYLDSIQTEINGEVKAATNALIQNAKVVEAATTNYAAAKLTHNIFKALRSLAEKELDAIPMKDRIRQPRQEEEESFGGDDEDNSVTEASAPVASVTNRTETLIPVLANILLSVFGGVNGTKPLNVTHTLQTAQDIIFRPFGKPIAGLNNLFGRLRPTPAPAPAEIKYYPVPVFPDVIDPSIRITRRTTTEATTTPTTTRPLRLVGREDTNDRVKRSYPYGVGVREDIPVIPTPPRPTPTPVYVPIPQTPSIPVYAPAYAPAYPPPRYPPTPVRAPVSIPESIEVPTRVVVKPAVSKPFGLVISPNPESIQSAEPLDVAGALPSKPLKLAPQPVYAPSYVPVHKPRPVVSTWQAVAEPAPLVPIEDVMITEATTPSTPATTPAPNVTVPVVVITAAPVTEAVTEAEEVTKSADNTTTQATSTVKPETGIIYIDSLTRDVQQGLDGIIKNLPDILKGVREGLSLLENIRDIFGEVDV